MKRVAAAIAVATAVLSVLTLVDSQKSPHSTFSINSPRGEAESGEVDGGKKPVLVKLPDDLEAVLKAQKAHRSKIHASILGLPPSEDIEAMLTGEKSTSTVKTTLTTTATRKKSTFPPTTTRRPTTTTTRTTRTTTSAERLNPNVVKVNGNEKDNSFLSLIWEAHVYFSGTLFVLLSIYCFINILRIHTFSRLFRRGYFIALNVCLIVIGIIRPIYLFHDPYNLSESWPRTASYLLLDTGFPCVTTAFAVLFLALLRATQIELVSPGFQRPRSLAIFCGVHFAVSLAIDIAVGVKPEVRYTILICQGFFIVWSLLLSAGYFYVFSSMKKIAMRSHGDVMRAMYPKVAVDPNTGAPYPLTEAEIAAVNGGSMLTAAAHSSAKPPLARAVHLTMGVAILGSLMGGVQLFGMIKMLGLQFEDINPEKGKAPWFAYQVSMRILEVIMCTLLAVIATTPLRADPTSTLGDTPTPAGGAPAGGRSKLRRYFGRFCGDSNPPREFEDEIYSEICSNNQSVRQMMMVNQIHDVNGAPIMMMENPYGTLSRRMMMNQQMMPMGTLRSSGGNLHIVSTAAGSSIRSGGGGQQQQQQHQRNSATVNSITSSSSNQNSTLQSGAQRVTKPGSVASSRATIDTGLYSNIRSRPSSMLFNDSGFVRFRGQGDPGVAQEEVLKQSTDDLTRAGKDGIRASQSFDDVILGDREVDPQLLSPSSNPEENQRQMQHSPIYKSLDGSDVGAAAGEPRSGKDPQEGIYEPPPGMKLPPAKMMMDPARRPSNAGIYSESDLESAYGLKSSAGNQIYSSRAESRCSSISATQSFDMRMYGKTMAAASSNPAGKEKGEKKLENPYYYYGSTRNQKKLKQKPRPLLPSQRLQMEQQQRVNPVQQQPTSRQPLLQRQQPTTLTDPNAPFQRSRSLGGYYNRGGTQPAPQRAQPPVRNQQFVQAAPVGSMTPVTYSRWQHSQRQHAEPRRYNPLYDTPPTQRHAHLLQQQQQQQQYLLQQQLVDGAEYVFDEAGNAFAIRPQQQVFPEVRGLIAPSPASQPRGRIQHGPPPLVAQHSLPVFQSRVQQQDQVLSPILTDQESSPLHDQRYHHHQGGKRRSDREPTTGEFYLSSDEEEEVDADVEDSDFDQFTSRATQGYNDGLADVESDVSSVNNHQQRQRGRHPQRKNPPQQQQQQQQQQQSQVRGAKKTTVSPLEYSAMLKLYSQDPGAPIAPVRTSSKDITPDSGVNMTENGNNSSSAEKKKSSPSEANSSKRKSRQSLLSSSSSLNDLLGAKSKDSSAKKTRLRDYSRVSTSEHSRSGEEEDSVRRTNNTVFSSSSSEDFSDDGNKKASSEKKAYHPLVSPPTSEHNYPAFRWDGSAIEPEQGQDQRHKKKEKSAKKHHKRIDGELDGAEEVVRACKEIQKQLREKKSEVEQARKKAASEVESVI